MWKRPEDNASPPPPAYLPGPQPAPAAGTAPPRGALAGSHLGPSLAWEGKLAGEEDLLVEGRFRGEIQLPAHQVTIGAQGRIEGEVRASSIVVEGEVRGNLHAAQHVVVRASGRVMGDIRAPRVALDQGCRFKGAIDMEPPTEASERREARGERNADKRGEKEADRASERLTEPPVAREIVPAPAR